MKTLADHIVKRVQHKGKGFAFTAKDLLDLGKRSAVDKALSSLAESGTFRRICRGVYDYPKISDLLDGPVSPDIDQVAHAIARNVGARIQPSGAVAANLLGLSEQVPAKAVYLTDGLSRIVKLNGRTLTFKRTAPRELLANDKIGTVVQALLFLGRDAVTAGVVQKLRHLLSPAERRRFLKDARYTTGWITDVARSVAEERADG